MNKNHKTVDNKSSFESDSLFNQPRRTSRRYLFIDLHTFHKNPLVLGFILLLFCVILFSVGKSPYQMRYSYEEILSVSADLYVPPQELLKHTNKQYPFILVDIRSHEKYEIGHINHAHNIPVEFDDDKRVSKKVLDSFQSVNQDKSIIIYSENRYDRQAEKLAAYLIENGIIVKILSVGWSEFRRFPNFWLSEDQWDTVDINMYVTE